MIENDIKDSINRILNKLELDLNGRTFIFDYANIYRAKTLEVKSISTRGELFISFKYENKRLYKQMKYFPNLLSGLVLNETRTDVLLDAENEILSNLFSQLI